MSIEVTTTTYIDDFEDLLNFCWSGALQTLNIVQEHNAEDEFMKYLEENLLLDDEAIEDTKLNDFIWFECDDFLESLDDEE